MSYTLRDLPLPVKVVASVFLMAVGIGYTSAMVQLHMQDSKSGKPLPTVADVVLKYTGKKWFETDPPRPVSKLERLIMGSIASDAVFNGSGSMAPAFFSKDPSTGPKKYRNLIQASPDKQAAIDAQREGERQVVKAWLNAEPEARRASYDADSFVPPAGQEPAAIDPDWKARAGFKVKSIIDTRCVACHGKGGPQENFSLESYEHLEKYMTVPTVSAVPPGGGWVRIDEPMSMDKLTQSTHAHLLSFAMLFSLTGLVFAFSSYPKIVRLILGPWVTVAVVVDVSLWWLARLSDQWGPYFAMGIIGTGGAAGLGLAFQITLSLFNMYGAKGKVMMAALFLLGGGVGALVFLNKIQPALDEKARSSEKPPVTVAPPTTVKPPITVIPPPSKVQLSRLDRVLMWPVQVNGKDLAVNELKFKGDREGGMVRAFFDRDEGQYKEVTKDEAVPQADKDALTANRHGELAAVKAWFKTPNPQRKAAYDADAFDPPSDLKGKPITADYFKDGKVKVKSIITDRCARCHVEGGDRQETQLDSYDKLLEVLKPLPPGDSKGASLTPPTPPPVPVQPAPTPTKAFEPIPAAKDD